MAACQRSGRQDMKRTSVHCRLQPVVRVGSNLSAATLNRKVRSAVCAATVALFGGVPPTGEPTCLQKITLSEKTRFRCPEHWVWSHRCVRQYRGDCARKRSAAGCEHSLQTAGDTARRFWRTKKAAKVASLIRPDRRQLRMTDTGYTRQSQRKVFRAKSRLDMVRCQTGCAVRHQGAGRCGRRSRGRFPVAGRRLWSSASFSSS